MQNWRWKHLFTVAVSVFLLHPVLAPVQAAGPADGLTGRWYTKGNEAIFEFYREGNSYCGRLLPLKRPDIIDSLNPVDSLKSRKLAGITAIWGLRHNAEKQCWEEGCIYNPSDGKTYRCTCRLLDGGKQLEFRGYLGIRALGQMRRWTRVEEP